jgi:hypothetical protein
MWQKRELRSSSAHDRLLAVIMIFKLIARAGDMRTVEMRLRPQELSGTMAAMRMWLDERRFEPSNFICHACGASVLVRVDFKVAKEADAFARCFGGGVDASSPAIIGDALPSRVSRADPPLPELGG